LSSQPSKTTQKQRELESGEVLLLFFVEEIERGREREREREREEEIPLLSLSI
jgi:hypothetical protein